jgi:hypothetical protein
MGSEMLRYAQHDKAITVLTALIAQCREDGCFAAPFATLRTRLSVTRLSPIRTSRKISLEHLQVFVSFPICDVGLQTSKFAAFDRCEDLHKLIPQHASECLVLLQGMQRFI